MCGLSTTGYENNTPIIKDGTIYIEGDDMRVFDKKSKEILRITGDSSDEIQHESKIIKSNSYKLSSSTEHHDILFSGLLCNLSSLDEGVSYSCNFDLVFNYNVQDQNIYENYDKGYAGIYYEIYCGTDQDFDFYGYSKELLVYKSSDYFDYNYNSNGIYNGTSNYTNKINFSFDYNDYTEIHIVCKSASIPSGGTLSISLDSCDINFIPEINKTIIDSKGINMKKTTEYYTQLNFDGSCLFKCGIYALEITNKGIYCWKGNTKYDLTT